MKAPIKLGIRQLVEFSCRSGDLGYDAGPSASALEGIQTHQKIQKRYRKEALAEQVVKLETCIDEYDIELSGRVDLTPDGTSQYSAAILSVKKPPIQAAGKHASGGVRAG